VAQVRVEGVDGRRRGSGYLVTDDVVLTAAHVVAEAKHVNVVFNADLRDEFSASASIALCQPTADVALLQIDAIDGRDPIEPAQFGRLDRSRPAVFSCRAVGFPRFKLRAEPLRNGGRSGAIGYYRDAHQADGTIASLSNWREGTLEFTVAPPEADPDPHASPWEGMSGAAVWCTDRIIGVVSRHYRSDGLGRLAASEVAGWYAGLDVDRLAELAEHLGLPEDLDHVPSVNPEAGRPWGDFHRRRTRGRRMLDAEYEMELARSFIRPSGWDDAVSVLRDSRMVLLKGAAGSGRRTAAILLLGEFRRGLRPIHELSPQRDDPDSQILDFDDVAPHDRLLLDLSVVDAEQFAAIQYDLLGLHDVVRGRSAILAVILPAGDGYLLKDELRSISARMARPEGELVFRAHLTALGVRDEFDVHAAPQLARVLSHDSMVEIAGLARLLRESQKRAGSSRFEESLGEALAAHAERAEEVAAQLAKHPDAAFRALLLSSGLLEGLSAEYVLVAHRLLLARLGFDPEPVHEFELPAISERFRDIDARVAGDSRVWFAKLRYAEAVGTYFWENCPALRGDFRDWVVECGLRIDLPGDVGESFVRKYGDLCLRTRRPDDLIAAIDAWAPASSAITGLALNALERGLDDLRDGWRFRRQCYYWSKKPTVAAPIAEIVISVCVDVIAVNFPNQAIVRLHHLTRHRDDHIAWLARSALLTLAGERRIFRRLLSRLIESPYSRLDRLADRSLFLSAADPGILTGVPELGTRLISEPAVRRQLVVGWRAVLNWDRRLDYEAAVCRWLAIHADSQVDDLIAVLVEACSTRLAWFATLLAIGREWLAEQTEMSDVGRRRGTVNRLQAYIDAARGTA
jgi:hypothetical protein